MSKTVAFEKEMAITHRDFVRLLARAVGHKNFQLVDGKISITEGPRKMEITLSKESEPESGKSQFPALHVVQPPFRKKPGPDWRIPTSR